MIGGIQSASKIPELRRRILFTLALLAVYRVGVAIPTPGINADALQVFFEQARGSILGLVNLFSGGALERFSIFALGIMPYISASIILQLLTVVFPYLERLSKEGELGRRKITQYTRYLTVVLSAFQSFMISIGLENLQPENAPPVVFNPGWGFRFMTMLTQTTGTAFIMWLGEQITERGIGNGISLIIFAGIVAALPSAVVATGEYVRVGQFGLLTVLFLLVLMVVVVGFIVFVERGQRRIPVQYAKRIVGRRQYGGQSSHLPLKVNTSGVIPPIFASSLLIFPATIGQFGFTGGPPDVSAWEGAWGLVAPLATMGVWLLDNLRPGTVVHDLIYVVGIIVFCFFYTAIVFNPDDVAENMKKFGGFIPGVRPGPRTAEYIDRILSRITLGGALYLSAVCVLPTLLIGQFNVPYYFGGTGLLIVVGVALDTGAQMETHLLARSYEGFMRRGRLRGRRG